MSNKQQTIVFNLQANIDQIKQSANEIDKMFSKLNLPQNLRTSFSKTFNKLTEDIRTFEVSASKGFNSLSDAKKAEKNIENIVTGFEKLRVQIKDIKGLPAEKLLPKESLDRLKKYKELLDKASKLSLKDNSASIRKATAAVSQAEKKFSDSEKSAKRNKAAIEENQKDYDELTGKINSTKEALDRYFTRKNELKNIKNKTPEQAAEFSELNARIKAAERSLTNYYKAQTQAKDEGEKLQAENSRLTIETEDFKSALDTARQALDDIKRSSGVTQEEIDKIRQSLANISNIDPNALPQTLQELIIKIQQLSGEEADLSSLKSALEQLGSAAKDAGANAGNMGQSFHKTNTQVQEDLAKTNSEIAQLKSRLTYFFSAMNGIQLFKNAIRSAYESVKELDAAITEMAVVTDYSINDIWGNIPQYTQTAKELGATTKDVINSMVLYTQQGLDVAHATELSTQTMKMARIAGLEGAEATDLMTAALRGFNMELNETSAQRVNDVYSNLAANAAANTQEIADAMTRTASIANAAGMEFETTAAFLTQMIETTRESAENLGTAMKTIVARFTEMKKSPNEIIDVEGEEVSANKVETALKSVGVQLRDTNGEFRDLDDVFLELASKWDSLDKMSQRYVATTAAGSRQQSRFIAMMSNYQRTMELTSYATNSAGASQKQFEKTMDSLESKLNRLHDVWEQFTTGIANQSAIKGIVDLLTSFLTAVNNLTDALDPLHTGWSKILAAFLGFKAAKGIVGGVLKNVGAQLATGMGKLGDDAANSYHKSFFKKISVLFKKQTWVGEGSIDEQTAKNNQKKFDAAQRLAAEKEHESNIAKQNLATEEKTLAVLQEQAIAAENEARNKTAIAANKNNAFGPSSSVANFARGEAEIANTNAINANSAAKVQNTVVTEAKEKAEKAEADAVAANTVAQELNQKSQKMGLLTKAKYYIRLLFGINKATRESARQSFADAGAKWAQASATEGATGAQAALNTTMMACPIGWILAGIAAVAAALVIFASVHETGAEKVERMDETMQKLNESARETTSAIDELSDTWEKLQEQNENLDKLTKGTLEWKKQLVEINQTVLDLIEKFPSLAAHVNMIDGQLEISEAGIEELQERQLKAAEIQQFASVATQLQQVIQKAKNENLYDEKNGDFKVDNYKDSQDRKEKEQKVLTYDIDRQQKTQLLVSSVLSGVKLSANVEDDEKLKSIISGALEAQDYNERLEEIKAETSEDRQAYADLLGLTETQVNQMIKDGDLTSDQLRTSLAAEKLLEEIHSTAEDIGNKLITNDTDEHIQRLIQNKLTSSDIEYFNKIAKKNGSQSATDFIINELKKLGISNDSELKVYADRIKSGNEEYKGLKEKSFFKETTNLIQILNSFFGDNRVDIANQKKLQEKFTQLSLSGIGENGKKEFIEVIKDILDSFGDDAEAKEVFINKFLDLDISSLSEIEDFFEELNVAGHEVSSQLQKEFKETTKAANDFSLENVQETLSSREAANAVKEKIKSDKDSDKSFTEEQYNKVTSTLRSNGLGDLADNFVKDPTSSENSPKYLYSGSLSELGDKLENSIDSATDKAIQKLEEQNKIVGNIERVTKESPDLIKAIEEGSYFKGVDAKAFGENGDATILITGIAEQLIEDIEDGTDGFFEPETVKSFLKEILKYTYSDSGDYYERLAEILNNNKNNLATSDIILLMKELIPTQSLKGSLIKPTDLGLESFNEVDVSGAPIEYIMNAINNGSIDTGDYRVKLKKLLDENLITIEQYNEWLKLTPKEVLPKLQQIINPSQSTDQIQADIDALYGSAYSGKTATEALKIFPKTEQALKAQNSLIQQIVESHEGWEIKLKEIKKQYNLTGDAATENARRIAAAEYELNEQVDNIRSVLSDNKEALENTGTDKYYESISKLVDAFKVIYGDKIDNAWVEENLGTIKQITVGKIEAEAAFKELQATAKAEPLEIPLKLEVEGDASNADLSFFSDKIKGFYDDWKENSKTLGEEIAGNSDKIKANITSIQEALTKIDKSDASIQIKADTRAALGELIKVALLQAYIKDDVEAYRQWLELANKNDFSIGGLEITRHKKMEVTFNNGKLETKELGSFGKEYLKKVGDVAVIDQSGSVQVTPNSEGTGNPDYDDKNKDKDKDKDTSSDDWENNYDKYYNALKRIEGIERERNKLAREQEKLTKRRFMDEEALKKNKQEQIALLKQQASINEQLANTAASYLRGDSNGDVWFDPATGTIQTNPNAAYYDKDQKEAFDKQLSLMENNYETWKTAVDNLDTIYDAIEELTQIAEFTAEDFTNNIDRVIEVLDNTLSNFSRELERANRYDSRVTGKTLKNLYEQNAQTLVDKYNQLTQEKAINEQLFNGQLFSEYGKYLNYNWDTKEVTKSGLYYTITDPQMKEKVDKFYDETVSLGQAVIDIDNQQEDIKDEFYDLKKNLLDKSLEFQEKVYDAVIKLREDEINNLNNIDNSIKNAASDLISSVQKNLQKLRQDRQNAKTEEELQNMEARLAYYQVDTSNANQKNILDLQKQLTDKQQSYTDSLIDQKISELQQQNDEAAAQRKRQIEIMETQLELDKENGVIWKAVDNALKVGFDSSGKIQKGSDLYNMLASLDEVTKKNSMQFERWFGELSNLAAAYNTSLTVDFGSENQMSNAVANSNDVFGENSPYIKSLKEQLEAMNRDGNLNHLMWYDQEGQQMRYKYDYYEASSDADLQNYRNKQEQYETLAAALANARAFYRKNRNASFTSAFKRLYGYDSGGLADYTGPAWLDGTKSSPELVLNSRDTENFIQLKDILANVMTNKPNNANTNGDFYFEIHIDVDKITSDYDVDQIASRIKQQITNEARYRNVNTINMIR